MSGTPLSISDEYADAMLDDRSLEQAVADYRRERGYGDGGWGEYLATKIQVQLGLPIPFDRDQVIVDSECRAFGGVK